MRFTHVVSVPGGATRVRAFIDDVPRVAACVPGVESVTEIGPDAFRGVVKVALGPVRLALAGDLTIIERGPDGMTLKVKAADPKVGGAVEATTRVRVGAGGSDGLVRLELETDAQILGRIAEFGQPIIKRKIDQLIAEFATRLGRAMVAAPEGSDDAAQ